MPGHGLRVIYAALLAQCDKLSDGRRVDEVDAEARSFPDCQDRNLCTVRKRELKRIPARLAIFVAARPSDAWSVLR